MKLIFYRPIKYNILTQGFGENKHPYYKSIGMLGHQGWDWFLKNGDKIYWNANLAGEVIEIHKDNSGGIGIVIVVRDEDGQWYKVRFWHILVGGVKVQVGQKIETGKVVALGNNTGISTNPHLHWDLKPLKWYKDGKYELLYPKGTQEYEDYRGAIDITPFFKNIFVKDLMLNLEAQHSILKKVILLIKQFLWKQQQ